MTELAIVNASPLIYLSHAGLIELLQVAGAQVLVPSPVAREIRRRPSTDPTVQALNRTPWLREIDPGPLSSRVASVLSLALAHRECVAVVDDRAGRRCAETLGIPLLGTLGLVLKAKRKGIIPAARPVVERLKDAGMYLSASVLDRALAVVGE